MLPKSENSEGCTMSLYRSTKDAMTWEIIKIYKIIKIGNQNISVSPSNY